MSHGRLLALVPLLFVLGCGSQGHGNRYADRTREILTGATRVEVYRTDGENGWHDGKAEVEGERRIGGFLITAQGQDQGRDFADKLAAILLDEGTYTNNFAKCYWPGVALRVWKDAEAVDVMICFRCGNLYCGPPTPRVSENATFHGSPRRADFVRLAREAFPDDKEIQALE